MGLKQRREKLKKQIAKRGYDFDNPYACKIDPLKNKKILELSPEEQEKYGNFKMHRKEVVNDLQSYIDYYLYIETSDKEWELIKTFDVYSKEFNFDHGGYRERRKYPPRLEMYVDIEDLVYYIEDENGAFYCTLDIHQYWWYHNEPPELRPYYERLDKLRKFKIPLSEEYISDEEDLKE